MALAAVETRPDDLALIGAWADAQRRAGILPNSITRQTSDARSFARWLGQTSILDATRDDVEQWMDAGRGRKSQALAPRTRYARISTLHSVYSWALMEGLTDHDPTATIRRPKVRAGLPRPIATNDLVRCLEQADQRMTLWCSLGAFAGLRCMEIAGLHRDDLLDDREMIRILGKGEKERLVPMHSAIVDLLERYPLPRRGPLFLHQGQQITPARVSKEIADFCASIDVGATAHNFRHWFGSAAYEASGDIRTVADLLGHSNLNTSLTYAASSPTRMRATVAAIAVPERQAPQQPTLPFG